ncbi:MAG: monovalent cation/H(+) antiporter subunit G [Alphaproteobacteria bacterium]|nr:monovalent cation/H(+) antiporter subunit G [Alphaproteobacteria bacterium]
MELVLDIVSAVLIALGSLFCIIGGIGLHRMPDFYTRTHAASLTDTLGAPLVLIGLMFQSHPALDMITVKLLITLMFLVMTSPVAGHALGKAAWSRGLKPWEPPESGGAS